MTDDPPTMAETRAALRATVEVAHQMVERIGDTVRKMTETVLKAEETRNGRSV